MTSKLKDFGGCSSHHLAGQGHIVAAPLQAALLVLQSLVQVYTHLTSHYCKTLLYNNILLNTETAFVLWYCWLGSRKGIQPVLVRWWQ